MTQPTLAPPAPTAPRASEEEAFSRGELARFVYTFPLAMLVTARDGRVRLLSAGAVALLVPLSVDGAVDNLFDLLEPDEPRLSEIVSSAVAGPSRRLEGHRIKVAPRGHGGASWLDVTAIAFDDGYSFTFHDATALVEREEQRRAAVAEEAHLRGKIETATAILHDLGNALTGIGSRAVEVRRHIADPAVITNLKRITDLLRPQGERLDALLGAAGRGKALVELLAAMATAAERTRAEAAASLDKMALFLEHAQQLLAIHRAYAGPGSAVSRGQSSVERILVDVVSMMEGGMTKRGGRLVIKASPAALPPVRVDRSKLLQVLLNLVKNASEAFDGVAPGGPRQVELSAALTAEGGIELVVRDSGPGFPAELTARLFEDGFSTKQRGSGVGLGACRKLIESLGGKLTLSSEGPGTGALARIELPKEVVAHGSN